MTPKKLHTQHIFKERHSATAENAALQGRLTARKRGWLSPGSACSAMIVSQNGLFRILLILNVVLSHPNPLAPGNLFTKQFALQNQIALQVNLLRKSSRLTNQIISNRVVMKIALQINYRTP